MADPLISVIMPAYNAQKYIAESIESVLMQTLENWELIIVDDGSTDSTAAIIKNFGLQSDRIKYFYQQNSGPGSAKNTAISHSKGDYIAFLDADDLWMKEKLAVSLTAINEGDYSLLFTDCYAFNDNNLVDLTKVGVPDKIYGGDEGVLHFLKGNRIPNLTVLAKKQAILKVGGFNSLYVAEDYDLWLRMLAAGYVFKSISAPLSLYRVHGESATTTDRNCTFEVIHIIKSFAQEHTEYARKTQAIVHDKIKFWLYSGNYRSAGNFRKLIHGVYKAPFFALFYTLSFIMPLSQLRKIFVRT